MSYILYDIYILLTEISKRHYIDINNIKNGLDRLSLKNKFLYREYLRNILDNKVRFSKFNVENPILINRYNFY